MSLKTRSPLGYMHHRNRVLVARGLPQNATVKTRWQFVNRSRLIAEASMLLIWVVLWIANGIATASAVVLGGLWLQYHGIWVHAGVLDWFVIGCLSHVVVSFVGQHLWRGVNVPNELRWYQQVPYFFVHVDRMRLTCAVIVSSLDATATGWYIQTVLNDVFGYRWWFALVSGLLAALVALSAEPMIRQFVRGVRDVLKGTAASCKD
ncbi:MAG TPA: hypothetical protein DEF47_22935 [Herpetosiphon sp.]|uniref:Uncharacterized protein n=1 Tax=Herpetosiphon aurantiacus (strain ATCC 23779 / DSM 785 / 114-95) TaxID=316274 RepID=A9B2F2_HERA2|nr:hypothetical protein [Herpetosiphon sp.]ABX03997.1 hypothetical protein Haur_1352 [Herpetosiphon aurantiacus DSM 785]HBW52746.1 hypothetical protein [Herpetosiphon sp.]